MKPVIQEESTGCAIASAAAVCGISYKEAKKIANDMGIFADDTALWSETNYIRKLLKKLGVEIGKEEQPFKNWVALPDIALLATKWHIEKGKTYWHWAVFVRDTEREYVLDSKKSLSTNMRTDFGRIKPKWYIEVSV